MQNLIMSVKFNSQQDFKEKNLKMYVTNEIAGLYIGAIMMKLNPKSQDYGDC